ncbi:MAG: YmdB family metallophosphoesterase, partial [bacterium]|nr:YmdB family metallophosphoesterase [bacterium]
DVYGPAGVRSVQETLPKWQAEHRPDFTIINAENSAPDGVSATPETLQALREAGADAFTLGDHFLHRQFKPLKPFPVVRPVNLEGASEGSGSRMFETVTGEKVLVAVLMGKYAMKPGSTHYFKAADELLGKHHKERPDAIFIEFHAGATSEEQALGFYLDGKASAVVGTHTHVPTADTCLLPQGTAFQSDVGMCGALDSVIGATVESSTGFLRKELGEDVGKIRPEPALKPPFICDAVLIETDGPAKSKSIRRLSTRP